MFEKVFKIKVSHPLWNLDKIMREASKMIPKKIEIENRAEGVLKIYDGKFEDTFCLSKKLVNVEILSDL